MANNLDTLECSNIHIFDLLVAVVAAAAVVVVVVIAILCNDDKYKYYRF